MDRIKVLPLQAGGMIGYDVIIDDADATLGEYVDAITRFGDTVMAPCRGCDGCCHERAPLMLCDFYLSGRAELSAWLDEAAAWSCADGVVDIMLRRTADSSCRFLDVAKKECRDHLHRPFVCRTHICLPQSDRAKRLRRDIVNCGLDALVAAAAAERPELEAKYNFVAAEYIANVFNAAGAAWRDIPIRAAVSEDVFNECYEYVNK